MMNYEKYFATPEKVASSLSSEKMYSKCEIWIEEYPLISAVDTLEFYISEWLQEEVND